MRILIIAIKDLTQIARNKKSALFILILPVLLTWLMGLVFSQNSGNDPRLPVGLVIEDAGQAAYYLDDLLNNSETVRSVTIKPADPEELEKQVRSQKMAAVIIIPPGFREALLQGKLPEITVMVDRTTPAGQASDRAIQLATTRLLGAAVAAQLSADAFEGFSSQAEKQAYVADALAQGILVWQKPRLVIDIQSTGGQADQNEAAFNGYNQSSAGMMVFFATLSLVSTGYLLIAERRSHTLARLITTPATRPEIMTGHGLAIFSISLAQNLLLTIFGQWMLAIPYWRAPGATLLMICALALFASGFGLFISALAGNENQVVLVTLGATLGLGLLGGAFFPLDLTGKTFSAIGNLLPSTWAIEGFQNITLRGLGLEAVLLPAGILAAYAGLCFGLSAWRFQPES